MLELEIARRTVPKCDVINNGNEEEKDDDSPDNGAKCSHRVS